MSAEEHHCGDVGDSWGHDFKMVLNEQDMKMWLKYRRLNL
jgi:hypothetical protein